jgi:hypothetical protein
MRPIQLTRAEAENIVDLLEQQNIPQFVDTADELRQQWGMCSREESIEVCVKLGHPPPPARPDESNPS